jgi:hypothetical protein
VVDGARSRRRTKGAVHIQITTIGLDNPQKYPWLMQLLARRPFKVVAIALANKMARVASAGAQNNLTSSIRMLTFT